MSGYLRKNLDDILPYTPEPSEDAIKCKFNLFNVHKLSSNENTLGPSPKEIDAIKLSLKYVNNYPDSNATRLKRKLADKNHLSPENFLIGNGAAEIIDLIAMAFIEPDDGVILGSATFPKYSLSAFGH